jgi:hypothetical protein
VEFHRSYKEDCLKYQLFHESNATREILQQKCEVSRLERSKDLIPFDLFCESECQYDFWNALHPEAAPPDSINKDLLQKMKKEAKRMSLEFHPDRTQNLPAIQRKINERLFKTIASFLVMTREIHDGFLVIDSMDHNLFREQLVAPNEDGELTISFENLVSIWKQNFSERRKSFDLQEVKIEENISQAFHFLRRFDDLTPDTLDTHIAEWIRMGDDPPSSDYEDEEETSSIIIVILVTSRMTPLPTLSISLTPILMTQKWI